MNLQRRISRLNLVLADKFGQSDGPEGRVQRFAWKHLGEVFMIVDNGFKTSKGGIILPGRQDYEKKPYSDRFGSCWCVCQWTKPAMTEWQWMMQFGTQFAYPKNGRYLPIDNTRLNPGDEPDESINEYVIGRIQKQLDAKMSEHLDQCVKEAAQGHAEKQVEFADRVDSWWPAFDNDPGKRGGHVSFGGVGESLIFSGR
jgi:hypothetical protein